MKKKIKSIAIVSILLLSMSISLIAVAAKPDKKWMDYEQRVHAFDPDSWSFPADISVYMLYGWVTTDEEYEAGITEIPEMRIYIDGEEVKVRHYAEKLEEDGYHGPMHVYYALFDAYTFDEGEYEVLVVVDNGVNVYMEFSHPLFVEAPNYPPPMHHKLEGYPHRIRVIDEETWTFNEDTPTYMLYGWATTIEEYESGIVKVPRITMFIDGEMLKTGRFNVETDPEIMHTPIFCYYSTFDAYYFEPGEYEITVVGDNGDNVYFEFSHPIFVTPAE